MQVWKLSSLLSLLAAFAAALFVAFLSGENPFYVFSVLINGAFGSATNFGYTLYYATPLMFTGLSVAWALRSGLFNIGSEGQMLLGGVAIASIGFLDLPPALAILAAFFICALVGGAWGALAGILKVTRHAHEVLTTILLNFIAYGIASFFISIVLRNPNAQVPETMPLHDSFWLPQLSLFGGSSPVNFSLAIAFMCVGIYGIMDAMLAKLIEIF